ncbi:hypothetical protein HDU93_002690, partial [Gonapodya sp. JEL0774]
FAFSAPPPGALLAALRLQEENEGAKSSGFTGHSTGEPIDSDMAWLQSTFGARDYDGEAETVPVKLEPGKTSIPTTSHLDDFVGSSDRAGIKIEPRSFRLKCVPPSPRMHIAHPQLQDLDLYLDDLDASLHQRLRRAQVQAQAKNQAQSHFHEEAR